MNLRKVYGGTPIGNASMCDTCVWSRIIQGYAESERIVICDRIYEPFRVPFKVSQCTDYEDRRLPHVDDLKEVALAIEAKRDRFTGFRLVEVEAVEDDETIPEEA